MPRATASAHGTPWYEGGDAVAYVFADPQAGDGDGRAGAIDTIPVSKTGWTDVAEVRTVAARWLRERARTG